MAGNHAVVQLLSQGTSRKPLEDKDLVSPQYAANDRLQDAHDHKPPMYAGECGKAVALLQKGLTAAGFPLPGSTKPDGRMDGVFGGETHDAVTGFQAKHDLAVDGGVGRETMGKLDELAVSPGPTPKPGTAPICPGGKPQNYDQRLVAIRATQTRVNGLIAAGLQHTGSDQRSRLWRNTCQWIVAKRVPLHVLIKTHDYDTRAAATGEAPAFSAAYFDATVAYPDVGGTYAPLPVKNDPHVTYIPERYAGLAPPGKIYLVNSDCNDPVSQQDHLIHEVQHSAGRGAGLGRRTEQLAPVWHEYVDEFRAHWVGTLGHASDRLGSPNAPATNAKVVLTRFHGQGRRPGVRRTNFKNERQERVFHHLIDGGRYSFADPYVLDDSFKKAVDGFTRPGGVNLANSTRVDDLLTAVAACEKTMTARDAPVVAMRAKARALDDYDRSVLRDELTSDTFWQQATSHLRSTELALLRASIAGR